MANEWVVSELYGANRDGEPRSYTIANGTSVSKGQELALTGDRTVVVISDGDLVPGAGVASMEHKNGDGPTISCWTTGTFQAMVSGAINSGDEIIFCEDNKVHAAGLASGAQTVGYALEAGTDITTAEDTTIEVRLLR